MTTQHLIVVGAGPKAMALAAKATVLQELGLANIQLHLVEKREIGAHWRGGFGFTDGRQILGTSPEKDVGFPYASEGWGERNREIDERMVRFSWQSFLIQTGDYSEWVDRGKPAPQHRKWASYLRWVYTQCGENVHLYQGEVTRLSREGSRWMVDYESSSGRAESIEGDGIVMTGPANSRVPSVFPNHDRLFTVESFWKQLPRFLSMKGKRIAVIGTGENAACITTVLSQSVETEVELEIISPTGSLSSRGESYFENRVYTHPESGNWETLTLEDREDFIRRTDRGVFSLDAQNILNRCGRVRITPGRVCELKGSGEQVEVDIVYNGESKTEKFDYVVLATGSDQSGFLRKIASPQLWETLAQKFGTPEVTDGDLAGKIGKDLSLESVVPHLHVPMLSGMNQGPGFANLSCLGRLSDRILFSYRESHHV